MAKKESKTENKVKKHFFKDFKAELKKVIWPTPKQLVNNTVAVVTIVLITAAIVFVLDVVFDMGNKYGISRLQNVVNEQFNPAENNTTDNTTAEDNTTSDEGANNTENNTETDGNSEGNDFFMPTNQKSNVLFTCQTKVALIPVYTCKTYVFNTWNSGIATGALGTRTEVKVLLAASGSGLTAKLCFATTDSNGGRCNWRAI